MKQTTITPPRVAFLDPRSGTVSREWYMFFLSLFDLTGGGQSTVSLLDLLKAPVVDFESLQQTLDALAQYAGTLPPSVSQEAYADQAPPVAPAESYADQSPALVPVVPYDDVSPATLDRSGASVLPFAVTPGASPYTYLNDTGYSISAIVQGGTVTKIEFSRDGTTFFDTGAIFGMFALSPFDSLKITYAVIPALTIIPR